MELYHWVGVIAYVIVSILTYFEFRYFKEPPRPHRYELPQLKLKSGHELTILDSDSKFFRKGDKIHYRDANNKCIIDTVKGIYIDNYDISNGIIQHSVKYCLWAAITWPIWCWRNPPKPFNI